MGVENFLIALNILNENGISMVTLTGGEPLLRPEIFFSLLRLAKSYKMEIGLNSNAVLINKEMSQKIQDEGLDHALISVLGTEKTHNFISGLPDGFKKTCEGIRNLVDAKVNVAVNMVASKLNQGEIYQVGKIVKELGVKTFCVTPMVPSHKSHFQYLLTGFECKEVLRSLLKTKKDFNFIIDTLEPIVRCLFKEEEDSEFVDFFGNRICSAAISSCVVSSKGNVRPCIHADKEFGNILKDDFSEIWKKMSFWSSSEILPRECVECNANIICEGGCRMSAKLVNGQYNGKDMYMTEPIMDMDRINKLPQEHPIAFENDVLFKINPEIKSRKEEFGWLVYVHNNLEFCTDSGHDFMLKLKEKSSFSLNSLIIEFNFLEHDIRPVISKFINNKIVQYV